MLWRLDCLYGVINLRNIDCRWNPKVYMWLFIQVTNVPTIPKQHLIVKNKNHKINSKHHVEASNRKKQSSLSTSSLSSKKTTKERPVIASEIWGPNEQSSEKYYFLQFSSIK